MATAFYFYGDELAFQRDYKVHFFDPLVISPEIRLKPGPDKLRIHIVFPTLCEASHKVAKAIQMPQD